MANDTVNVKAYDKTAHNFLLYLRNHAPWAARLFDSVTTLGVSGAEVAATLDPHSWPGTELSSRREEVEELASAFIGRPAALAIAETAADTERLPHPVRASKHWNHVAFLSWNRDGAVSLFVLPKPSYEELLKSGADAEPGEDAITMTIEPASTGDPLEPVLDALPEIVDKLASHMRQCSSYVQFVVAFAGHTAADRLEARLYALKEWGTPSTPQAVLSKYIGRFHYVDPSEPPTGVKISLSPLHPEN